MHALVIEDDEITAMMIEDELRDLGYSSIDRAATEEDAIMSVARRCPDLVTSDGSLLRGSGISAVRKIHASVSVPVIFITGDPEHARENHPDAAVLGKPFSIAQLVAAVEQTRASVAAYR